MLHKEDKKKIEQIQMIALDQLVPAAHLLRKNDRYVDFDFIYGLVEDIYCKSAKTVPPFTVAPPAKTIKKPLPGISGKTPWTSRKTTATPPEEKQNTNNDKKHRTAIRQCERISWPTLHQPVWTKENGSKSGADLCMYEHEKTDINDGSER